MVLAVAEKLLCVRNGRRLYLLVTLTQTKFKGTSAISHGHAAHLASLLTDAPNNMGWGAQMVDARQFDLLSGRYVGGGVARNHRGWENRPAPAPAAIVIVATAAARCITRKLAYPLLFQPRGRQCRRCSLRT